MILHLPVLVILAAESCLYVNLPSTLRREEYSAAAYSLLSNLEKMSKFYITFPLTPAFQGMMWQHWSIFTQPIIDHVSDDERDGDEEKKG